MTLESDAWNGETIRVFAGASLGRRTGRLKTVVLRCRGEGWGLKCLHADALSTPPPPTGESAFAVAVADALSALVNRIGITISAVDVLGLFPFPEESGIGGEQAAEELAERTGATVVAGFELRDRAAGGRGRPLSPVPDWFLFHSLRRSRLLVHMGPILEITLLRSGGGPSSVLAADVGPCGDFLDGLVKELSRGECPYDPSGRFAVQGRFAAELVSQWSSHPFFLRSLPRFLEPGEFGPEFREASLALARDRRLSGRDVLCSANHFIVRNLSEARQRFFPARPVDEVLASGGGCENGLLWKLLSESFAPIPVRRIDRLGIPSEARSAIHAALLAYCTLENLPASFPSWTGARRPSVLGRISAGDRENWDHFICNLYDRLELDESSRAA